MGGAAKFFLHLSCASGVGLYVAEPANNCETQDALRYEEYPILPHYHTCPADELFDYMADTLLTFAELHGWCARCLAF